MNIAFFINSFPPETFILDQLVSLIDRGHQVDIEARAFDPSFKAAHPNVERYGLRARTRFVSPTPGPWFARMRSGLSRLRRNAWRHPAATMDALNLARHGRLAANLSLLHEWLPESPAVRNYDVIHCHYAPNGLRAVSLRKAGALRGAILTTFHGYDANVLPRRHGERFYERLFLEGDRFTVGSEFMRARIVALGAPPDRIVRLPMGVSLARFAFAERECPADGELRLLTVARLVEVKGIEYAIRAVALLRARLPRVRYVIVGDGPLRDSLESLSKSLGLEANCEFRGALGQDAVAKAYADAHLFLCPSIISESGAQEGQSVALVEAQASGMPVIATSTGANAETMQDGKSGVLVPPRDSAALATAIAGLAGRRGGWSEMSRAGRAHVEEHYDLDVQQDRLIALYGEMRA